MNITPEDAKLYRKIEDIKKQYPSASIDEIIKHMEPSLDTVQIQLTYDQIVAQWKKLTFTEKALAIACPAQALLVDKCRAWHLVTLHKVSGVIYTEMVQEMTLSVTQCGTC